MKGNNLILLRWVNTGPACVNWVMALIFNNEYIFKQARLVFVTCSKLDTYMRHGHEFS